MQRRISVYYEKVSLGDELSGREDGQKKEEGSQRNIRYCVGV